MKSQKIIGIVLIILIVAVIAIQLFVKQKISLDNGTLGETRVVGKPLELDTIEKVSTSEQRSINPANI